MHTIKEASTLWCPHARVAQTGNINISAAAYNRIIDKQVVGPATIQGADEDRGVQHFALSLIKGPSSASNCLASRCAAWRWRSSPNENNEPQGYCGMAGYPGNEAP